MKTGFVAFLFMVFAYAIVSGWNWPEGAKVYVLVTASFGLVLTAADLILSAVRRYKGQASKPAEPINSRELGFFAYILAYAFAAYLFGGLWASALFVFAFLKFYNGSNWLMSGVGAAAMATFLWAANQYLGLFLLQGVIRL